MHGVVPLSRGIAAILHSSSSRIPHLALHILRRQARSPAVSNSPWATPIVQRRTQAAHISTVIDSSSSEILEPAALRDDEDIHGFTQTSRGVAPLADEAIVRPISMEELLEENNPDRILLGLATESISGRFIEEAEDSTFAQAICALDPDYFIQTYRDLHHYLKPTLETQPRFRAVRSVEERTNTLVEILDNIVGRRREAGHAIPFEVYRHLLRYAAIAGFGNMARTIFRISLPENGMIPDLDCYNHLMEALVWNEAYGRHERYNLRIHRRNMERRSRVNRPKGFIGHGVASPQDPDSEQSIRLEVLRLFNELVRQGLSGDEATFCNLMIAMGREGDTASVKSVLKSVWNIDLDGLQKYDEEELESPTFYEELSPLRPSERLLFTVVHVFCTNNEIGLASMLVDYVSRNYNLAVPGHIWTSLLEWTFVLSTQNKRWHMLRGYGVGRVAREAVDSLYQLIHNEPYSIKPNVINLIFKVKSESQRHLLDRTVNDIRECIRMLEEDRIQVSLLYDQMAEYVKQQYDQIFQDGLPSPEFLSLRRGFTLASLRLETHLQLIIIAVRNTFRGKMWWPMDGPTKDPSLNWPYRALPDLMQEWTEFLPNLVAYYTPTGHVQLLGLEHRAESILSSNSTQTTKTGSMRQMFDTYSPAQLRHAADFVHRGPTGLIAFWQERQTQDGQTRADWVSNLEQEGRRRGLKKSLYGHMNDPAGDWRINEWRPNFMPGGLNS